MPALSVLVLHGPNLNLLGLREPGIYGSLTLAEINRLLESKAMELQAEILPVQSNHEGVLVDAIHGALGKHQGIVITLGLTLVLVWLCGMRSLPLIYLLSKYI